MNVLSPFYKLEEFCHVKSGLVMSSAEFCLVSCLVQYDLLLNKLHLDFTFTSHLKTLHMKTQETSKNHGISKEKPHMNQGTSLLRTARNNHNTEQKSPKTFQES